MNEITKQFIRENLNADVPTLALKKAPVGTDLSMALREIEARQLLQKKVPEWSANFDLRFPPHRAIEQCSSEATARYKAALVEGHSFADLTGGLGIDTYYISSYFADSDYVEPQAELCAIASHNFDVLHAGVKVWNETAEAYLNHCEAKDWLFVDPSRRDASGHKTVSIADCSPNLVELQDRLFKKTENVLVKLSPMLDVSKALTELHGVREIHVLAVANECKELLFVLQRGFLGEARCSCVNLQAGQAAFQFTAQEERDCPLRLADGLARYLYEPNAALMKAGCFKLVSSRFGVNKLHKHSHLYTSDVLVADFPGRVFEVEGWTRYNKKAKQVLLPDADKANLAVRNFPLSVEEVRKSLKIKEGGETYLFATTMLDDEKVMIRTKKSALS